MRKLWLTLSVALSVSGCTGLQQATRDFPPLIVGSNTVAVTGPVAVRACPTAGARVEQKGGPTLTYLGSVPGQPDLCRMRVDGDVAEGWYGIWLTDWAGADVAHTALTRVMANGTGAIEAFEVRTGPNHAYYDIIRNEGVEHLQLLGRYYDAIKLAHYREGRDGNTYRSVSTVWKDLPTGMLIYATYQHIAGTPVTDDPLIPTVIVPGR